MAFRRDNTSGSDAACHSFLARITGDLSNLTRAYCLYILIQYRGFKTVLKISRLLLELRFLELRFLELRFLGDHFLDNLSASGLDQSSQKWLEILYSKYLLCKCRVRRLVDIFKKKRARERSVNREMIPHVPGFHSRSSQNGVMSRRSKTADGRNKKRHKLTNIAATGDIWDKVGVKWKCQDQVVKVLKKFDVRY